jgi:hypothetical protein
VISPLGMGFKSTPPVLDEPRTILLAFLEYFVSSFKLYPFILVFNILMRALT